MATRGELRFVPISKIFPNTEALRTVNKETEKYLGLLQSVRQNGVLQSVNVSPTVNEMGEEIFTLCDGLHRWSAAKDAGLEELPCNILTMGQYQLLETQIITNIQRVETKPIEYTKGLVRLLTMNRTLTKSELAAKIGVSTKWVDDRLSLVKITNPEIEKLIDSGEMKLSNAYFLAKLPPEEQTPEMVQKALIDDTQEFSAHVNARVAEIRKAAAEGRKAQPAGFTPVARLRKLSEINDALKNPSILNSIVQKNAPSSIEAAVLAGIKWVQMMDAVGVAEQEAKDAERKRLAEQQKAARDLERQKKAAATASNTGVVAV